ncbi:MAG: sigma-70 family RNA polymerase sigma factor [Proteobacteria bacterium]|nr:sigma-70 family RNA polymerase sigma factor [Pseudomonadota bacterium]
MESSKRSAAAADGPTAPSGERSPERDRLIHEHLGYVRSLAGKVRRELGGSLDHDELVAFGMRGLVEAADRFDATRGIAFTTFSYYRIRGAIFDGLRQLGWLSRSEYARFLAASNELLANTAERPTAGQPEVDTEQALGDVVKTLDQVATIFVMSLGDAGVGDLADTRAADPALASEQAQVGRAVRAAIAGLPERERTLIEGHYYRGLTLEAVGQQLGLSKSWASRLHARAIAQLTEALGPAYGP